MHPLTVIVMSATALWVAVGIATEWQRLKVMRRANKELDRRGL